MFVDSHLHLDFDDFAADRDGVLARAADAGVDLFVTIGIRVRDSARVLAVAERYDNVYATVGTLPHYADEEHGVTVDELVALARHPKVVGIGEAGLDRFFGNASWDAQQEVFRTHLAAARETGLPIVIHSVREDQRMAEMLVEESARGAFPILMHGFSGGRALADTVLGLGGYFSFGGLLTYPENAGQRAIAATLPADRILLETDSPSLAPLPMDADARNEPSYILHTARLLAELRGINLDELATLTTANFYGLFAKVPQP